MTRKCHNHILQTNPWHCDEESKNDNRDMTIRTQQKNSNQLSPSPFLFPTEMIKQTRKYKRYCKTKQGPNTKKTQTMGTNNGSNNTSNLIAFFFGGGGGAWGVLYTPEIQKNPVCLNFTYSVLNFTCYH